MMVSRPWRQRIADVLSRHANSLSLLLWPVFALVGGAIAWHIFLTNLQAKEERVVQEVYLRIDGLAQNYAERIDRTIDGFDRTLLHVRYDWALSGGTTKLEGAAGAGIFPHDAIAVVSIFDEAGNGLTSSALSERQFNISDRTYFQIHKDGKTDQLLIGPPLVGRVSDQEVILLSRRISGPDGTFKGVVLVSIRPEYLSRNFSSATFGEKGYLGLVGTDGVSRAARIGNRVLPLHSSTPATSFTPDGKSPKGRVLLEGENWFIDQRSRIVGWHKVKGSPLIAMVGLDKEEALGKYYAERDDALSHAYWTTVGLVLFTLTAMIFSYLLLRRKKELELVQTAYRAATEEGDDGFYINRPLRNKHGQIYDFIVVDCNHRGAELFHLQRDQLIGKTISDFYEGEVKNAAFARLIEALENGIHESEVKVTSPDRLNATWINYKAVRSGDDLAVTIRDISETKAHLHELERRGNEDALTGLPNRHWIQMYLPQAISQAKENKAALALLFIDIDGFKTVNDTLGHTAGDNLLKAIAARLKNSVRPQDRVVRLGGDEYVVVVEGVATDGEVRKVAERVLGAFSERFHLSNEMHTIGASIGVSIYPRDGNDAETLLKNADIAMYAVKTSGKGNYRFYQAQFYEELKSRLNIVIELRRAIDADEFEMHYQPRVNILSSTTSSLEALVRWNHPTKGLLSPAEFIPVAESSGLILQLGELIINKVCQQISLWSRTSDSIVPVSINVSARQFNEVDMLSVFSAALARHKVQPHCVEIEVTETLMMNDDGKDMKTLSSLRDMGIKLCLDDFGTGYSSLSQLQKLDFDVLKIDKSFTAKIADEEGKILCTSIITMAHALGMRVVAEGVETKQQMEILRELQCDEAQGYFISKPVPAPRCQPTMRDSFIPLIRSTT
jgi:diguanylate cyclase